MLLLVSLFLPILVMFIHNNSVKKDFFFPNILEGIVWEDWLFSPKEHNVKKKFEAKTEVIFLFFFHQETSFSMPAGEHNLVLWWHYSQLPLCISLFFFFFRYLPSCLLKAKDISEIGDISLPNRGVYLDLNWWLANTDNSRTFLFIFPSSESYRNRCLNVWLGGSSQWTGIQIS